jgi:hypothetical protein
MVVFNILRRICLSNQNIDFVFYFLFLLFLYQTKLRWTMFFFVGVQFWNCATSRFASTIIAWLVLWWIRRWKTLNPPNALPFKQNYATRTAAIINPSIFSRRNLLLNVQNHHPELLVLQNISCVYSIYT